MGQVKLNIDQGIATPIVARSKRKSAFQQTDNALFLSGLL
jgi:hypothetical protein